MFWWLVFITSTIVIYVKLLKPLQHWKERNVPRDKPWPIIGSMGPMVFRTTSFAEWTEDLYKNSKTRYIGFHQFLSATLMVKDIDLIKKICIKEFDNFVDHRSFISEEVDPLFGKNIFSLKGQKWRHMRSTLSPAFTSSKMRSMFVFISACAEQFTKHFLDKADSKNHITVEMKDVFTRFANDVIATSAFGIECNSLDERNNEFYLMGKKATNFEGWRSLRFFGYNLSPILMKFFKIKLIDSDVSEFFRNLVKTNMASRENKGIVRPDMIHLLMQARKGTLKHEDSPKIKDDDGGFAVVEESHIGTEVQNKGIELSDDDITAQAVLFFLAGFDTISTMMCHMANELTVNPEVQDRLRAEIDQTIERCNGEINYEAIMKMKYLDTVVCETLRKWPPSPMIDRLCTKSYIIEPKDPDEKPLSLYKGDLIFIPIYAIQRDPEYYPNPNRFDPERFSDENKNNINPITYLPFGIGPRNCIGSRFALLEVKTVFIHLLSKFELVVDKKTQIPLKLSRSNFAMTSEKGFWIGLKPRK